MANKFNENNFDLLRLLAATQVLIVHAAEHLRVAKPDWWPTLELFAGVPIFFVMSGFLISASYERSSTLGNYVRNRFLRIYPALWFCIAITVAVFLLYGFGFPFREAIPWLLNQIVGVIYTPKFLEHFGFGSYNGSLWTIPIELQFYACLPLIYRLTRASSRTQFIVALWLIFLIVSVVIDLTTPFFDPNQSETQTQKVLRYTFIPHFYLFLAGVVLQRIGAQNYAFIAGKGFYWIIGYVAFAKLSPWSVATFVTGNLILAVAVVALAYTLPKVSHRILRGNDISYGTYIYHGLLINIFIQQGYVGTGWSLIGVATCSLLVAMFSWRFVERPLIRRKRQTIASGFGAVESGN